MLFHLLFGSGRTLAYTVHESPSPPADRIDRAEALRFVKDGFTTQAAVTGPLWLAAHRLWLPLGLYAAIAALLLAAKSWLGLSLPGTVAGFVALHLLVGFEADAFERADLERKGWASLGAVTGNSMLDCQRRFFDQWLPLQPILASAGKTAVPSINTRPAADPPRPAVTTARGAQSAAGRLAALWRGKS